MTGHKVKISSDGIGGKMEIDGHDISDAVRGATINFEAQRLPQLLLDLVVWDLETDTGDTVVQLPPATRDALYALGWTPPDEDSG